MQCETEEDGDRCRGTSEFECVACQRQTCDGCMSGGLPGLCLDCTKRFREAGLTTVDERLEARAVALVRGSRLWVDDIASTPVEALLALAEVTGSKIGERYTEPCTLMVKPQPDDGPPDPERMPIERVSFRAWLRDRQATVWCMQGARTRTGSPVPWPTAKVWPWVVEIVIRTTELEAPAEQGLVAFAVPCPVDPREPSPTADAAIGLAVLRAMIHEGQESLLLDGVPWLDPHTQGELALGHLLDTLIGGAFDPLAGEGSLPIHLDPETH